MIRQRNYLDVCVCCTCTAGSHFDEYLIEFTRYKPGPVSPKAWLPPAVCSEAPARAQQQQQQRQSPSSSSPLAAQLLALLPSSRVASSSPGESCSTAVQQRSGPAMAHAVQHAMPPPGRWWWWWGGGGAPRPQRGPCRAACMLGSPVGATPADACCRHRAPLAASTDPQHDARPRACCRRRRRAQQRAPAAEVAGCTGVHGMALHSMACHVATRTRVFPNSE